MRKFTPRILSSGLLCIIMMLSAFLSTGVFAAENATAPDIGINYWRHVQNKGDVPGVNSPTPLGTRGQGLRIEGFCFDLTGAVPAGAKLVYEVHVQNKGWMTPVSSTNFAGTRGESLRVESIRIRLENLPGYDVYYQGHVQNKGNTPQVNGAWSWVKNGEDLGTVGESLRLEEITVKIVKTPTPPTTTTYDQAQTYGPATGVTEITGDAAITVPGVTLQNLHINGNLTIAEGVGSGDVTLNNITVDGDTFVNGGGKNSIHINSGSYHKITVGKTASGEVRIVAIDVDGLEVVIAADAKGQAIILEGNFDDVTVNAPDMNIQTQGATTIGKMTVNKAATGCLINMAEGTKVKTMVLDSGANVSGKGTIDNAEVNADGVKFETAPAHQKVAPDVKVPPVVTPPVTPGGGGGGTDPSVAALAAVNGATSSAQMQTALEASALKLNLTKTYANGDTITYKSGLLAERKTAIATDMLANRPSSGGYKDVAAAAAMFDDFANSRIVIQCQLGRANTAIAQTGANPSESDLIFIDSIIDSLGKINQTITLSGQTIGDLKAALTSARSFYNDLKDPQKEIIRTELQASGHCPYSSLSVLLTDIKQAYIHVLIS